MAMTFHGGPRFEQSSYDDNAYAGPVPVTEGLIIRGGCYFGRIVEINVIKHGSLLGHFMACRKRIRPFGRTAADAMKRGMPVPCFCAEKKGIPV